MVAKSAAHVPPTVATLVSVTDVRLSPDLAYADVSISAIEGADKAVQFLKKEKMREIGKDLADRFRAHTLPKVRLRADHTGEKAHQLESLIDRL